jgi:hypothetical protein
VTAFEPLLGLLADVADPRRGQGQLYKLPSVLLFSILAIVTAAIPIVASSPSSTCIATS